MKLFIDTSNWSLHYLLIEDEQLISAKDVLNEKKISDIAVDELTKMLFEKNLTINNITEIYLTIGPGSYTGVRIGLTIAKTLKALDNSFRIFIITSLKFQAVDKPCLSIIDARGGKWFAGIYPQAGEQIEIWDNNQIDIFKQQNPNIVIKSNLNNVNFYDAWLANVHNFKEVDDINALKPLYIKNFI